MEFLTNVCGTHRYTQSKLNNHTHTHTHAQHKHSLISLLLFSQGEVSAPHLHPHLLISLIASDTFSL